VANATETLTIVLKADGTGLTGTLTTGAGNVRKFGDALDRTGKQATETGQRTRKAGGDVDEYARAAGRAKRETEGMDRSMGGLRATLAGLGITLSVRELGRMADTYTDIRGKISQVTQGLDEQRRVGQQLLQISNQTYQNLDATVTLYNRGYAALERYGVSQAKVAELTRTINQGLLVSRATTAESASAVLQLSQALGAGALRGEEFNAVNEAAPRLMKALAESIGVPRGELKKLAEEGALTTDVLLRAWTGDNARRIADEASQVPLTISRAWQVLRNNLMVYVGEADQAAGASRLIAVSLGTLAENLGTVIGLVVKFAAVAAVFYVGGKLQAGLKFLQALWIAQSTVVNTAMISVVGLQGATTRLTVAQTAAAIASRGLAAALTFLSANPILLLVSAVTLLVAWLWQSEDAAKAATDALRQGFSEARRSLEEFNRAPSIDAALSLSEAKVGEAIDGIKAKLAELADAQQDLSDRSMRSVARFGFADPSIAAEVARNASAIESYNRQLTELQLGSDLAAKNVTGLVLASADLTAASPELRAELTGVSQQLSEGRILLVDAIPQWQSIIERFYGAEVAARVAASSIREVGASAAESAKLVDQATKNIQNAYIQLAGVQGGEEAAIRRRVGYQITNQAATGKPFDQQQLAEIGRAMQAEIEVMKQLAKAREAAAEARKQETGAVRDAARTTREKTRDDAAAAQATRALNDLVRDQQAVYAGPVQKAANEYAAALERIDKVQADLIKHHRLDADAQRQLQAAREEAKVAHERRLEMAQREQATIDRNVDVVGSLVEEYQRETRAVGLSARERAIAEGMLKAETRARELHAQGLRDTIDLTEQERAQLRELYGSAVDARNWLELQKDISDEYRNAWLRSIESVADAFTDFIMSGMRDFKSLGASLKNIAKQLVGDLVRTFLQQKIVIPIQAQVSQAFANGNSGSGGFLQSIMGMFGGGNQGGGNMLQSIMGMFGGNGFSAGGQGNWMSNIGSLFGGGSAQGGGNWMSAIGSLFGGSGAASAASTAGGTWGGLVGMANASTGVSGASGAAAGGASGMASAIPIIGWIIAGMMKNAELFDQGWDINNGESWAGKVATLGAVGNADKLFRSLGFSDKISSILSGSSIHAKLFGRKKPQIQAQGITGSYGFDGFEGQAYADIKQKGGLFRSSKYWTEYAGLDNEVDRAFDGAVRAVKGGALSVAKQLGVDISKQLAGVRVNIGKIKLDADPEKAQQQIEAEIAKMVESLSASSVRALGFGRLLDNENKASDIMTALSAAITLVTGSAEELGRSLRGWEMENVARAVEYFKKLAAENGTSLGSEIERVTTLLGNYAGLMSGVETELRTSGLNNWQRAALDIEVTYRDQIKAANDYARALGLSGARAEDLAKIEQLRAMNMAGLQRQMEEERNSLLGDLSLSQYSPMTDAEKLQEAMQQLQAAAAAGDMSKVSSLSQTALGLGRNLYASGADYNALYSQVTGLIEGMGVPELDMDDGTTMGDLADELRALPDGIAAALFALLYNPVAPAPPTGGNAPVSNTTGNPNAGNGGTNTVTNDLLRDIRDRLGGGLTRNELGLLEMLR